MQKPTLALKLKIRAKDGSYVIIYCTKRSSEKKKYFKSYLDLSI